MTQELANAVGLTLFAVGVTVLIMWMYKVNKEVTWSGWDSFFLCAMWFCTFETIHDYIETLPKASQVQAMESRKASELK